MKKIIIFVSMVLLLYFAGAQAGVTFFNRLSRRILSTVIKAAKPANDHAGTLTQRSNIALIDVSMEDEGKEDPTLITSLPLSGLAHHPGDPNSLVALPGSFSGGSTVLSGEDTDDWELDFLNAVIDSNTTVSKVAHNLISFDWAHTLSPHPLQRRTQGAGKVRGRFFKNFDFSQKRRYAAYSMGLDPSFYSIQPDLYLYDEEWLASSDGYWQWQEDTDELRAVDTVEAPSKNDAENTSAVPLPSVCLLLFFGLAGIAGARRGWKG
ncbi:MAG: hypothetical protein AB1847_14795 [bacterium]